jgi:hypothetical protein
VAKVGEVRAKFTIDSKDFESGIIRIEDASKNVAVQVTSGFNKMEGELRATGQAVKAAGQEAADAAEKFSFERALDKGVSLFQGIAGAVSGFRAEMDEAGGRADDLRDRLAATFGDLADEKAKLAEQSLVLGFDADETANALVTLKKFGADSEATLVRLQDAARFTNLSVAGLADSFGKFEKFGDAKSLKALQKELGISAQDLEGFGAKLKDANTILLDNEANTKLAADALRAYMEANFAGAADRQADAATRLAGELELLKREIGGNVVALKEGFAPALVSVVQSLRELPDGVKAAIGVGVELVGMFASVAATGLTMASQLVVISQNATIMATAKTAAAGATNLLRAAFTALATPLGLVVGLLAGLGVGIGVTIAEYQKLYDETDKLTLLEAKRAQGLHEQKDLLKLIGDNAKESAARLLELGKTSADITKLIQGLQDQVQAARNQGNTTLEAQLKAQVRQAIDARSALGGLVAGQKEVADQAAAASEKLLAAYKSKASNGVFATDKEQLAALDQVLAKLGKQDAAYEELSQKRIALARKVKGEEDKASEGDRKNELAERLQDIDALSKAGELSKQQELARLKEVLNAGKLSNEERRSLETQIATVQGQIRSQALADTKKHNQDIEAETKASTERQRALLKARVDAQKSDITAQIAALEADLSKVGALPKIQALLNQRLALTIKEINAERDAALQSAKSAGEKAEAIGAAEAKIRAARRLTANDLAEDRKKAADDAAKVAKANADQVAALGKAAADAQQTTIDQQVSKLEDDLDKKDVLPKIKALLDERLALTIQGINAERDAILKSATSEEVRAAAVKAAEEKVRAARGESTAKLEEESKKQKDALQAVADKQKEVADDIKSRVGGKNSPLYSDRDEGINFSVGDVTFGKFNPSSAKPVPVPQPAPGGLVPVPTGQQGTQQAPLAGPIDQKFAKEMVDYHYLHLAEALAAKLREQPIQITNDITVEGKKDSQTFGGTLDALSRAANTHNPDHKLAGA